MLLPVPGASTIPILLIFFQGHILLVNHSHYIAKRSRKWKCSEDELFTHVAKLQECHKVFGLGLCISYISIKIETPYQMHDLSCCAKAGFLNIFLDWSLSGFATRGIQ